MNMERIYKLIDIYKNTRTPMTYVSAKIKFDVDLLKLINSSLSIEDVNLSIIEKLYLILNNRERPKCTCGEYAKFRSFDIGYLKYCSNKCLRRSQEFKTKMSIIGTGRVSPMKGKTYLEIYGTADVKCGYQKGINNISNNPDIKDMISKGVCESYKKNPELRLMRRDHIYTRKEYFINSGKLKFKNSKGELFRSSLEVGFSEFLLKNNIPYEYERKYSLNNGKVKIVDFVLYDHILVEVSGYAYTKWRLMFQQKINILRDSVENPILILTYPNFVEKIDADLIFGHDMYMGDIFDTNRIKSQIEFIMLTKKINENGN